MEQIEFLTMGGTVCGPYGGGGGWSDFFSIHPGCALQYLSGTYLPTYVYHQAGSLLPGGLFPGRKAQKLA